MGRKIFVSYKYRDDNVKSLDTYSVSIVRDYVDEFEKKLDYTDHIYKGEENNEDLSKLDDETIWSKLKDRIYDSTLTVVFISPGMKESYKKDRDQWIPWEISYSLKEISRHDSAGNLVTSKTNAMLAVVLPDRYGDYNYYLSEKTCCTSHCITHKTDTLFYILKKNKFNKKTANKRKCETGSTVWTGDASYIEAVRWDKFIANINYYIDKAYDRLDNIDDYEIVKEVEE